MPAGDLDRLSDVLGINILTLTKVLNSKIFKNFSNNDYQKSLETSDRLTFQKKTINEQSTGYVLKKNTMNSSVERNMVSNLTNKLLVTGKNDNFEDLNNLYFTTVPTLSGNTVIGELGIKLFATYTAERSAFDSGYKRMIQHSWYNFASALAAKYNVKTPYVSFIKESLSRYALYKGLIRRLINIGLHRKSKPAGGGKKQKKEDVTNGLLLPTVDKTRWDDSFFKKIKILTMDDLEKDVTLPDLDESYVSNAISDDDIIIDILSACFSRHSTFSIYKKDVLPVIFPNITTKILQTIIKKRGGQINPATEAQDAFYYFCLFSDDIPSASEARNMKVKVLAYDYLRMRDLLLWLKTYYARGNGKLVPICDIETGHHKVCVAYSESYAKIAYAMKIVWLEFGNEEVLFDVPTVEERLVEKGAIISLVHDRIVQETIGHWHNILDDSRYSQSYYIFTKILLQYTAGISSYSGNKYHTLVYPFLPTVLPDNWKLMPKTRDSHWCNFNVTYQTKIDNNIWNRAAMQIYLTWFGDLPGASHFSKSFLNYTHKRIKMLVESGQRFTRKFLFSMMVQCISDYNDIRPEDPIPVNRDTGQNIIKYVSSIYDCVLPEGGFFVDRPTINDGIISRGGRGERNAIILEKDKLRDSAHQFIKPKRISSSTPRNSEEGISFGDITIGSRNASVIEKVLTASESAQKKEKNTRSKSKDTTIGDSTMDKSTTSFNVTPSQAYLKKLSDIYAELKLTNNDFLIIGNGMDVVRWEDYFKIPDEVDKDESRSEPKVTGFIIMTRANWLELLPPWSGTPIGNTDIQEVSNKTMENLHNGKIISKIDRETSCYIASFGSAYERVKVNWMSENGYIIVKTLVRSNGVGEWNYKVVLPYILTSDLDISVMFRRDIFCDNLQYTTLPNEVTTVGSGYGPGRDSIFD